MAGLVRANFTALTACISASRNLPVFAYAVASKYRVLQLAPLEAYALLSVSIAPATSPD